MLNTITVEKLHSRDYRGNVYNLEVEDNHNYFVDDILVSNCHGAKSYEVNKIGKRCINADYRFGFTGTLSDSKIDNMNIQAVLGEKIFDLKPKELIEKGVLSNVLIANIILKYPENICLEFKPKVFMINGKKTIIRKSYIEELDYLYEKYEHRNKILKWIFSKIKDGENSLILVRKIEHLKKVEEFLINNLEKGKYKIFVVYGETKAAERERIRKLMESESNMIIVSNFAVFKMGINIKKLMNVVLYSSLKSDISIPQAIGRSLRAHSEKVKAVIWDVVDDLRIKKFKNYCFVHFLRRLELYKKYNFDYITKELEINKIKEL